MSPESATNLGKKGNIGVDLRKERERDQDHKMKKREEIGQIRESTGEGRKTRRRRARKVGRSTGNDQCHQTGHHLYQLLKKTLERSKEERQRIKNDIYIGIKKLERINFKMKAILNIKVCCVCFNLKQENVLF